MHNANIPSMEQRSPNSAWVQIDKIEAILYVRGGGDWLATNVADIDAVLRQADLMGLAKCVINLEQVHSFDITGAWLVERLIRGLRGNSIPFDLQTKDDHLTPILKQLKQYQISKKIDFKPEAPVIRWISDVGESFYKALINTYHIIEFLGQLFVTLMRCCRHPSKLRIVSIVAIMNRVGLNAVPIVALISFLIGVVLVYQGAFQLRKFGAEIYTVDLLAISHLREIGILLTAIIVAGRSGSAFAAQIGTMKLNQEVDALRTFGLDPLEVLVVPRIIALILAMPILAFIADMIGLAGGAIMSYVSLDISFSQYLTQLNQSFEPWSFWVGIIKAPFFGFVIALIGCYEGMQVHGGSLSVGMRTTRAVVESIFLVIVMDAIFSILFTKLDI